MHVHVRRAIAPAFQMLTTWRERVATGLTLPERWAYFTTAIILAPLFAVMAHRVASGP